MRKEIYYVAVTTEASISWQTNVENKHLIVYIDYFFKSYIYIFFFNFQLAHSNN